MSEKDKNQVKTTKKVPEQNKETEEHQKKRLPWWALLLILLAAAAAVACAVAIPLTRHTHAYSETYTHDETDHWHKCTGCDNIDGKAPHTYDNDCDTTCNDCGATRTITHNYGTTYQSNDNNHWQECSVCHTTTTPVVHTYSGNCDVTCNVCGHERTVSIIHTYEYKSNDSTHWQECSVCHATTIEDAQAHTFDSGKCTICDFIEETQGLGYTLYRGGDEDQYYGVASIGEATAKYIKIPATHNGIPVTQIGPGAFIYETEILSIEFPNITSLSNGSFTWCHALTKIVIPAGVTEIRGCPIIGCTGLTEIIVESGNAKYHVEGNCLIETETNKVLAGLKDSIIPDTATSIDDFAFCSYPGLTSIVIPSSIIVIGQDIFEDSYNLSAIYYCGTETQWGAIDINSSNSELTSATIYYLVENENEVPTDDGNYWHYVGGVPKPW